MPKPKSQINSTIRKSITGTLNLDGELTIEVEDVGEIKLKDALEKFNGEHGRLVFTVSNNE